MKIARKISIYTETCKCLYCPTSTKDNVKEAGEKLFLMLYGGKSSDSLVDLRYAKYMKMVSESVTIKPETLPPTASAAAFHVYRAFYQTQVWNTLMEATLGPTDWGWILENDYVVPVMTLMSLLLPLATIYQ